ncbi:MAG: FecR family protein [Marinicella sp.]|nr:FecR domain-containing protein [Xanthomonadales bacterium]
MTDMNNKDIEHLLTKAGHRIKPEQSVRDEVYNEVHALWLKTHGQPFYRKHALKIAASFIAIFTLFGFVLINQGQQPVFNIANQIVLQGQINISHDNKSWALLNDDETISPGDYIKTQKNNRLLVELNNGNQFRVDENTHLKIASNNEIQLMSGRIYIDSDSSTGHHKLTVNTPVAYVNHIGTQYSVSFVDDELSIGVRNGLVLVNGEQIPQSELKKGKLFSVKNDGAISYSDISPYDRSWDWTQKINRGFVIQNSALSEYLDWVSSETGYPIKWASDAVKIHANNIILAGSINGIMPFDSLAVILPTTSLNYSIVDDQIYIQEGNR